MTILDQLREQRTGQRRLSDFRQPAVTELDCHKTGQVHLTTFAVSEEYVLRATIGVTFWANPAQYHDARIIAERALLHRLYGDTLQLLDEAKHAVFDGDAVTTLEVLDTIIDNLTRGSE